MKTRLSLIAVLFSLFVFAQQVQAQFTKGTVIRLVNKYTGLPAAANSTAVNCVPRNDADYSQMWYVHERFYNALPIGYKVVLRNLGNGYYLQGNNNSNVPWSVVKNRDEYTIQYDGQSTLFTTDLWEAKRDGYYGLGAENKKTGNTDYYYDKLYCDGEVCMSWMGAADGAQWTIELVNGVDVQAQWDKLAAFENVVNKKNEYQGYLNTLFTDNLCNELRSEYKSQSALHASSAYQSLPQELKDMAMKACSGNWAETNKDNGNVSWSSSTAKRFRIQKIEAHSVAEEICNVVKTSAYSNMNNPTGLYANNMQVLYIMVKGNINSGAALYLTSLKHNAKNYITSIAESNPIQLVTGLNIIPFYGDRNMLYLMYSVNSQSSSYPLTNYPDIEVHIEGGCINGMYDSSMNDASRFEELKRNASKAGLEYYDVLGKKFTFHTSWETVFNNNSAESIERAISTWDMIGSTQHMIMGVSSAAETAADPLGLHTYTSDFSRSFNNRQLVHTLPSIAAYTQSPYRIQFMHGEGILRGDDMERSGYIWGPVHEMGHANQNMIKLVGTTEISNNLFSNVAVFYQDYLLSRGGTVADNCNGYKSGTAWHFRDSNSRMRMMYQLWLYYHAAGKNRNFYPKLFEYLRNDPMSIPTASNGDVYTSNEAMKFYKYACRAAGEDLTPFFEAWGFFVPFGKSSITDYADYNVISQSGDISAAKNEVAGYGYGKNYSAIFIEDRIGSVMSKKFSGHVKTWFDNASDVGSTGQYSDYIGNASMSGEYVWMNISDNVVKVDGGTGAVGVILEKSGSMYAFYNRLEFEVDNTTMSQMESGACVVKVVGADNSITTAKNYKNSGSDNAKKVVLGNLISKADDIISNVDEQNRKVGYYAPMYTQGLQLINEKAKEAYDNSLSGSYDEYIDRLTAEINSFEQLGGSVVIGIVNGGTYMLENKRYKGHYMYLANNNEVDGKQNAAGNVAMWQLEYAGATDTYYIKNKYNNLYVEEMTTYSTQVLADENSTSTAGVYKVEVGSDRTVSFTGTKYLLHLDAYMNIVGWFNDAEASFWYVYAEMSDASAAKVKMDIMKERVKWLVEEISTGASFGATSSVNGVASRYSGLIEKDGLLSACHCVSSAMALGSSVAAADYNSMTVQLSEQYNILKKVYDTGHDVVMKAAVVELEGNIRKVQSYISGVAVTEKLELQCTNRSAPNYISSNAEHNAGGAESDGGGLQALLDGSETTYFHSRWAGTVVDAQHYLQVDMGAGNSISEFCFDYSVRDGLLHAIPLGIVVSGSNDGNSFEHIVTYGESELSGNATAADADYSLNSTFAAAAKNGKKLSAVKLNSPGYGEQSASVADRSKLYNDMTSTVFKVMPGETVTASFVKDGDWNWMHGYIYIDTDNNGFNAAVENNKPSGDLVTYSFYGSETNEQYGYDSNGRYISGDERSVLDPPSFKAPVTPGIYRMRYKVDWNSIDPGGDNNSNFGGTIADTNGSIIDVTLQVGDTGYNVVNSSFVSDTVSCEKDYRYLRFTVTKSGCFVDSHNCSDTHLQYNGRYFFCLSEFGLTKIGRVDAEGSWLPLYTEKAEELLERGRAAMDKLTSVDELTKCSKELEQMADILVRAVRIPLPVELADGAAVPVYYRLVSAIGNSPLEYEMVATPNIYDSYSSPLNLVAFAGDGGDELAQAWYFMRGSDVGQYLVCPVLDDGKVLGTNPAWVNVMQPGDAKVWGVGKNMTGYITEWTIDVLDDGSCVLSPVYDTTLVLGRYNAMSQKLGFVNDPLSDNARFVLEETEVDVTSVNEIVHGNGEGEALIYDLAGRRLDKIVAPGFYIVGGRKVYVRP